MVGVQLTVIPENQRRCLAELADRLDLSVGDYRAKRSAFWIMLVVSAVIAVAGVAGDSTATVIGAMIIAPLSTPILGIGFGVVTQKPGVVGRSVLWLLISVVVVIALGVLVAQVLPNPTSVLSNSQVTGRTSPKLMDLVAAIATGFAGAIAITRRDVGDVLPGVAIAISLVPPLAVVGVCLGSSAPALALGAFVLFGSNVLALIVACTVVLMGAGCGREALQSAQSTSRTRSYLTLALLFLVVLAPMSTNSLSSLWAERVRMSTEDWLTTTDGAEVQNVTVRPHAVTVDVLAPGELPELSLLQEAVDEIVPWGPAVIVEHTVGRNIAASSD